MKRTAIIGAILGSAVAVWSSAALAADSAQATAPEAAVAAATPASPPVVLSLDDKLDLVAVVSGGMHRTTRSLNALDIAADIDLERLAGFTGLSAHFDLLHTSGKAANEPVGALQGIDAAEPPTRRTRLFQAYAEWSFPGDKGSARLGFSDVTGEFAAADSAAQFMNPSFGASPEFAASGVSAYPSTAFGLRVKYRPSPVTYVQSVLVNSHAATVGDPGGPDFHFREGTTLVGEVGWTGRGKVAMGYWSRSRRQDDLFDVDAMGAPVKRRMSGAYLVVDQPVMSPGDKGGPALNIFARIGHGEGRTSPAGGGTIVGALFKPGWTVRPDAAIMVGYTEARLGHAYRSAAAAAGTPLGQREQIVEIAFSDLISKHIRVQPDFQRVQSAYGDRTYRTASVFLLRVEATF